MFSVCGHCFLCLVILKFTQMKTNKQVFEFCFQFLPRCFRLSCPVGSTMGRFMRCTTQCTNATTDSFVPDTPCLLGNYFAVAKANVRSHVCAGSNAGEWWWCFTHCFVWCHTIIYCSHGLTKLYLYWQGLCSIPDVGVGFHTFRLYLHEVNMQICFMHCKLRVK